MIIKFISVAIICLALFKSQAMAETNLDAKISVDLQSVAIQDALHILSRFMQRDVIISPKIHGMTSLHLTQIPAAQAFNLLLMSNDLRQWQVNHIWYIGPSAEYIEHTQAEFKIKTLLDETAPLKMRIWQIQYTKAADIAVLLDNKNHSLLSNRGHVRVDVRTNILYVYDTADHILEITKLIKQIDIPVPQVLIETHLASIDSDFERELGVDFAVAEEKKSNVLSSHYGLAIMKLANGTFLDVQLSALEKQGHGELISSPSLFTSNQQPASIESGEEIPYQEISRSGGTGVAFKKAVLSLKVTPQVMPGDYVLLQLQVNQDQPSKRVVLGVPAINTRQINTQVLVKNGQTVVLGGIYETNKEHGQQRIPFLSKIPLVGGLFQQQNVSDNKRELLIFVTPKIM